ncbi:MAG: prepilin peptidase [Oscillospiraceae bacterium]|nr:prepilin peptidase [Oscillospiraceae bacterium]
MTFDKAGDSDSATTKTNTVTGADADTVTAGAKAKADDSAADTADAGADADKDVDNNKAGFRLYLPYTGIPFIVAALILVHAGRVDDMFILLWCALIIVFGYVAAVSDIKVRKIPNNLILVMLSAWVLTMAPKLVIDTENALVLLLDAVLGFAVGGGLFLLIYLVSRKGLGGGDVKFMAAAGLFIGFSGTLAAMLYGTILAALTGLTLLLLKKIGRKDQMPLAPFIYVGILIIVFYR